MSFACAEASSKESWEMVSVRVATVARSAALAALARGKCWRVVRSQLESLALEWLVSSSEDDADADADPDKLSSSPLFRT